MKKIIVAGVFLILAALCCPSFLFAGSVNAKSLRGIGSMDVLVEGIKPGISGLTNEAIQTDVELKLRMAGIKVDSSVCTRGI